MKIQAVYEEGIFKPLKKPPLKNKQKVTLHLWPEDQNKFDLEASYKEASEQDGDLTKWASLDAEGWQ